MAPTTARLGWEQDLDADKRQPYQQDQYRDQRQPAEGSLPLIQGVVNPPPPPLHLPTGPGHEHPVPPSVLAGTGGPPSLAALSLPTGHPWQQQYERHHSQLAWPTAGVAVNDASLELSGDRAGAYMHHGGVIPSSFQPNASDRPGHGHGGAAGVGSASFAATANFGSLASELETVDVFDNQVVGALSTSHNGWAMQVDQAQTQQPRLEQQPITYQPDLTATFWPYEQQHQQQHQQYSQQQGPQHQLATDPAAALAAAGYQQQGQRGLSYHPNAPQGQDDHSSRSAQSRLAYQLSQPLGPGVGFPASDTLTMVRRGGRSSDAGGVHGGCYSSPSSPEHLPGHNPFDFLPSQGLPPFKPESQGQQLDTNNEQIFSQSCWATTPPPSRGQWSVDNTQYADDIMFPHGQSTCHGLPADSWYARATADPGNSHVATVSPKDIRFPSVAPPPAASDETFRTNLFVGDGSGHDNDNDDGRYALNAQADPSKLYLDRASPSVPTSNWPQQQHATFPAEPTGQPGHDLLYLAMVEGIDIPGGNNGTAVDRDRPLGRDRRSSSARQKKPSRTHQRLEMVSKPRREHPTEEPQYRSASAIPDLRPGGAVMNRRASLSQQGTSTAAAAASSLLPPSMTDMMHQRLGATEAVPATRRSSMNTAGNKLKRRSGDDSHVQHPYQGDWEIQPMPDQSRPYPQQMGEQEDEDEEAAAMTAAPMHYGAAPRAPLPTAQPAPATAAALSESTQSPRQRRATRRRREPDTPPDSADDDEGNTATAAATTSITTTTNTNSNNSQVLPAGASKQAQDEFLLRMRRQGVPYKTILANGNFDVEEATLRTRHRSLVKRPEERPRVPEWTAIDVSCSFLLLFV